MSERHFNERSAACAEPRPGQGEAVAGRRKHPPLRVLHLEDNPDDAELIRSMLENDGLACQFVVAQDRAQFQSVLAAEKFDLILSDFSLPDYDGISALRLAREQQPEVPFILVSGSMGEEYAVESLKSGATDYILKTRLLRLPTAVRRAVQEAEALRRSRRIDEELRARDESFRALTENSPDAIARLDRQLRFVYCNPALERFAGLPMAELVGRTWIEAGLPPIAEFEAGLRQVLREGAEVIVDFSQATPLGRKFFETRLEPEHCVNGQVQMVLAVTRDVTRIRTATEELRKRLGLQERLTKIATTVPGIIYAFRLRPDGTTCLPYASPTIEEFCGIRAEDLEQDAAPFFALVHPEDRARMEGSIAESARTLSPWQEEFRIDHAERGFFWIEGRSTPEHEADGGILWHGFMSDISERKRVEESFLQLSRAIEQVPDSVLITDNEGVIQYANPALLNLTGYAREEIVGRTPRLLKSGQHEAALYRQLWETILAGKTFRGEFVNRKKNGETYIEEKTIAPVFNAAGVITHFVACGRDITARKESEARLARAQEELVALSRQAGMAEVATGVLHNVGNVLNSVNVAAHCLSTGLRKSKTASLAKVVTLMREHTADLGDFMVNDSKGRMLPGYLDQLSGHLVAEQAAALKELVHLQKNIEHIKDIITMQQGFAKVSGLSERVLLSELVEDALAINASSLAKHHIAVVREFSPVPPVTTEKHKVLQILVNLIRNAQHACQDSAHPEHRIIVRLENGDDHIRLSVRDNGVGIPAENLMRIFNHGFTTKKDGHGFGLHSGALAAKQLGGTLRVHSEGVDQGAVFTLELPVSDPQT